MLKEKPLHEKKLGELDTYKRLNPIKIKVPKIVLNNSMTDKERDYFIIGQKIELEEMTKQLREWIIAIVKDLRTLHKKLVKIPSYNVLLDDGRIYTREALWGIEVFLIDRFEIKPEELE